MKKIAAGIVAYPIFLWDVINIIIMVSWIAMKYIAEGVMHSFMEYHNRIQLWADDGQSLFEQDNDEEDE